VVRQWRNGKKNEAQGEAQTGDTGFLGEYWKRTEPLWIQGKVRFCWVLLGIGEIYGGERDSNPRCDVSADGTYRLMFGADMVKSDCGGLRGDTLG
jgi:hypothetical protein